MTPFILGRADVRVLLWHLALYGLAAILDETGVPDVRLSWTPGMQPRGRVTAHDLSADAIDGLVAAHARSHANEPSWVLRDTELRGSMRGLMSPRLTPFDTPDVWNCVQTARHHELDQLTESRTWLDLRLLAALGEPCYWSQNRQGVTLQDDGASRLEMQPRNQGSEFVGSRLRKLAHTVSSRPPGQVAAGLSGATISDEAGSDQADSRTPTGLASPGPTDNAVAWCALWGISQLPSTPRVNATTVTTGHIGRTRTEWFYTPVWQTAWRPSRLRSVLLSRPLRDAAALGLPQPWGSEPSRGLTAQAWLNARDVIGVMRFPIARFGSDSAPERRAMLGEPLRTQTS